MSKLFNMLGGKCFGQKKDRRDERSQMQRVAVTVLNRMVRVDITEKAQQEERQE